MGRPYYDVSSDGERFLMIEDRSQADTAASHDIIFVNNWFEELKARVPVN